jgi:hypothetical protein
MTRKQTAKMKSTGLNLVERGEGTSSSKICIIQIVIPSAVALPQLSTCFRFVRSIIYIRHIIKLNDNISMYAAVRIR